jgi:hypothetical protein
MIKENRLDFVAFYHKTIILSIKIMHFCKSFFGGHKDRKNFAFFLKKVQVAAG